MKFYGVLILILTISAVCGLRCYTCLAADKSCRDTEDCSMFLNRCYSLKPKGLNVVKKGCTASPACIPPFMCCEGDFCNGAVTTGHSVIMLLLSSALITLFN